MFSKQGQSATAGATAVQAGGNVTIIQGISASEARQIALDLFEANFFRARGVAREVANARGEHITDAFLAKLQAENPDGLSQANSPDFQDAMFTVQKEYAKAGDEELGDLLVDLLVDRTKQPSRNLLQLVLNESLHTAPKLTAAQIGTLSAIFMLRYVAQNGCNSSAELMQWFESSVKPAVGTISTARSTLQHLEFTGCGTQSLSVVNLENAWAEQYQGLFMRGFDANRLQWANLKPHQLQQLFRPCLTDPTKLQVAALNRNVLAEKLAALGDLSDEERGRVQTLYGEGSVDAPLIKEKLLTGLPWLRPVCETWANSQVGGFQLTSVGMAIAHANIKRVIGEFAPLSIWIDEGASGAA